MNKFVEAYNQLNDKVANLVAENVTSGNGYMHSAQYKPNTVYAYGDYSPKYIVDYFLPLYRFDTELELFYTMDSIVQTNLEVRHFSVKRWKDIYVGDVFWFYVIIWDSINLVETSISYMVKLN